VAGTCTVRGTRGPSEGSLHRTTRTFDSSFPPRTSAAARSRRSIGANAAKVRNDADAAGEEEADAIGSETAGAAVDAIRGGRGAKAVGIVTAVDVGELEGKS
jgi:hypothetical protein